MNKEQPINIELAENLPGAAPETLQEPADEKEQQAVPESVTKEDQETVSEEKPETVPETVSGEEPEAVQEEQEGVMDGNGQDTEVSGNSVLSIDLTNPPSGTEKEEASQGDAGELETTALDTILGERLKDTKSNTLWIAVIVLGALVIALGAFCISLLVRRKKMSNEQAPVPVVPVPENTPVQKEAEMAKQIQEAQTVMEAQRKPDSVCRGVGKVHNIGRRSGQQDSLGTTAYRGGVLAVVADGMGGLSDGDKVSQKIVLTMMQDSASLVGGSTEGRLYQMVAHVNSEVNHMLGMSDQYKSGSTLIAVLVEAGYFQWISVGDSRIYLYRGQQLLQINREHVYEADLLQKAVNHEIGFGEIAQNPQKKSVSSFIGMGELKYIDGSMRPVKTRQGDRLLLMSDGVFNTLSEQEICNVLSSEENAEKAARILENQVLARQNPKQDNFTAIILDL